MSTSPRECEPSTSSEKTDGKSIYPTGARKKITHAGHARGRSGRDNKNNKKKEGSETVRATRPRAKIPGEQAILRGSRGRKGEAKSSRGASRSNVVPPLFSGVIPIIISRDLRRIRRHESRCAQLPHGLALRGRSTHRHHRGHAVREVLVRWSCAVDTRMPRHGHPPLARLRVCQLPAAG